METKQHAIKNQYENEEIKRKSENTSRQIRMETQDAKSHDMQQKQY